MAYERVDKVLALAGIGTLVSVVPVVDIDLALARLYTLLTADVTNATGSVTFTAPDNGFYEWEGSAAATTAQTTRATITLLLRDESGAALQGNVATLKSDGQTEPLRGGRGYLRKNWTIYLSCSAVALNEHVNIYLNIRQLMQP